MSHFSSF